MSTKRKAENLPKFLQAALNQKELLDSILQNSDVGDQSVYQCPSSLKHIFHKEEQEKKIE